MMETFSAFSMVGVYETRKGLKFVHITSEKFAGKFTVLIFMDNRLGQPMCPLVVNPLFKRLTELEAEEWKSFNDKLSDFKAIGAQVRLVLPRMEMTMAMVTPVMQVVGVCTDSHVTVRTMLMNSASLKVAVLTIIDIHVIDIVMSLKGIKFPIICDRDGDFSRAFGVLKLSSSGNFGAARAVFLFFCIFSFLLNCFYFSVTGGSAQP